MKKSGCFLRKSYFRGVKGILVNSAGNQSRISGKDESSLQFEVESTFVLNAALWEAEVIFEDGLRLPDTTDPRFEFDQVEPDPIDEIPPKLFARRGSFERIGHPACGN